MAEKFTQPSMRRAVFAETVARLVGQPRLDRLRGMPLLQRLAGRKAIAVRACASGVEVCVTAPDEATARVLRAALTQTAVRRGTDRLIRIVVD